MMNVLEKYGHGGDLRSAQDLYGLDQDQFVDFSSNMNPLGPPPIVGKVLSNYMNHITAYPDPAVRELRSIIGHTYDIDADSIIVGNGAAELIDLLVRYFRPKHAAILAPSFIEYEQALLKTDCEISYIYTSKEQHFALTFEALQPCMDREDISLYILGHPNNPTGQLIPLPLVKNLLLTHAIVILDEAFIDFHPEEEKVSFIREIHNYPNLFVIRSMTKFYSIPGIRLGYTVGAAPVIAELKQMQVPWSVNSLAQQIGVAVLQDEAFARQSKAWLAEEKIWMRDQLMSLGLNPIPTVTNYMLVSIPESLQLTSDKLQQLMGMQGVLIRNGNTFKGLDNRYIRLAIKSRELNQVCLEALKASLKQI